MMLSLVITERCNAACAHCWTSCGPTRHETLTVEQVRSLMDQAAALDDARPLTFGLTGGEPFLDFDTLLEIVTHGTAVGARVTCTTNAYWATSDDKTHEKLAALRGAGLTTLGISVSRFHDPFVRRERVARALRIGRTVGIATVLKCAITASDRRDADGIESWARRAGADVVDVFPVLPYLRKNESWAEEEFIRESGLPQGTCPAPQITVRPDGTAYTCCHPGATARFHALGNALADGLEEIRDRFHLHGIQRLLRERGPIHFARAAEAAGMGHLLRDSYGSVCDLCAHIGSDPRLAAVSEGCARDYEKRQFRAMFVELIRQTTDQSADGTSMVTQRRMNRWPRKNR